MKKIVELKIHCLLSGMPGISQQKLTMDIDGILEDAKHYGPTRIADSRSRPGIPRPPKGTVDENWRMFSAITLEDLAVIQKRYYERYGENVGKIEPGWIGPNIVFSGMENFSKIPVGTILEFKSGPALIVFAENKSCATPGKLISRLLNLPLEMAGNFVQDADGYRGVVGKIYRPGILIPEMVADVYFPE